MSRELGVYLAIRLKKTLYLGQPYNFLGCVAENLDSLGASLSQVVCTPSLARVYFIVWSCYISSVLTLGTAGAWRSVNDSYVGNGLYRVQQNEILRAAFPGWGRKSACRDQVSDRSTSAKTPRTRSLLQ